MTRFTSFENLISFKDMKTVSRIVVLERLLMDKYKTGRKL
jgi:hypothetical protein